MREDSVPLRLHSGVGPPVLHQRARSTRWYRRHAAGLVVVTGLLCGAAGAYLATTPAPVTVYLDAAGYHINGSVLAPAVPVAGDPAGRQRFAGDGALILERGDAGITGVMDMRYDGQPTTAVCIQSGTHAHCDWHGGVSLSAEDTLEALPGHDLWHRRYSDGRSVEIAVPNQVPVPVLVPVGR